MLLWIGSGDTRGMSLWRGSGETREMSLWIGSGETREMPSLGRNHNCVPIMLTAGL